MKKKLSVVYAFAIGVILACALLVVPLGAMAPCCADTGGCVEPPGDRLCCNVESWGKCYDSWLPFNDLDGFCMTLNECAFVNMYN